MVKTLKSLKTRLFLWFTGSLLLLTAFFLLFVHFRQVPHGLLYMAFLFIILALGGFLIIFKITRSITYLSARMKMISGKNLFEKIEGVGGEDEIGELADSFNNLLDRLDEAFNREKQFIADMAHEMKTPIAILQSSFEVALQQKRPAEEYRRALEDAIQETGKLSLTLNNVLDLAWSEAENNLRGAKKINLTDLLEEIAEIAGKMAAAKKIKVTATFEKDIFVNGYKDKLARSIVNIVENAIKFSPEHGCVLLKLEKKQETVRIYIIDNGPGIPAEDLPLIFERFYRGNKTNKVLGSGLGLAIAKSLISLHHGNISVASEPGKLTEFMIELPVFPLSS